MTLETQGTAEQARRMLELWFQIVAVNRQEAFATPIIRTPKWTPAPHSDPIILSQENYYLAFRHWAVYSHKKHKKIREKLKVHIQHIFKKLEGVRKSIKLAGLEFSFNSWNQMVKEKLRLRSNPFIEASDQG